MSASIDSGKKASPSRLKDEQSQGRTIEPETPPAMVVRAPGLPNPDTSCVALAQLSCGVGYAIRVMVCRQWDSTDMRGKTISRDYILSDEQSGAIHCTVWSGMSHRFATKLREGRCYTLKGFTVKPNKEKFRVRNSDKYCIQLECHTTVTPLECDISLFQRYPFQLVPFEDITPNGSTYLLDVVGLVTRIGQINSTRNGSHLADIHIQNERGTALRVTLWGGMCKEFSERSARCEGRYIIVLPGMHVKEWKGETYLSSTSVTTIHDDKQISAIRDFGASLLHAGFPATSPPVGPQLPRKGTLLELLQLGREQKANREKESITLHCEVKIANVRTKFGWYYFSCLMFGCKKGVRKVGGQFWCDSCSQICEFPQTRYRLHLDISDETAIVAVTIFDEVADHLVKKRATILLGEAPDDSDDGALPPEIQSLTNTFHLLELKTHTYYNHGDHESFTISRTINSLGRERASPDASNMTDGIALNGGAPPIDASLSHAHKHVLGEDLEADQQNAPPAKKGCLLRVWRVMAYLQISDRLLNNLRTAFYHFWNDILLVTQQSLGYS